MKVIKDEAMQETRLTREGPMDARRESGGQMD